MMLSPRLHPITMMLPRPEKLRLAGGPPPHTKIWVPQVPRFWGPGTARTPTGPLPNFWRSGRITAKQEVAPFSALPRLGKTTTRTVPGMQWIVRANPHAEQVWKQAETRQVYLRRRTPGMRPNALSKVITSLTPDSKATSRIR